MTDPIPQELLDEAAKRSGLVNWRAVALLDSRVVWCVEAHARTLREIGWKPPVPPELRRAREIAARAFSDLGWDVMASHTRAGIADRNLTVQAVLTALREGMNGND